MCQRGSIQGISSQSRFFLIFVLRTVTQNNRETAAVPVGQILFTQQVMEQFRRLKPIREIQNYQSEKKKQWLIVHRFRRIFGKEMEAIQDGTSNTVAVSEIVTQTSSNDASVRSGVAKLTIHSGLTLYLSRCVAVRDPNDNSKIASAYVGTTNMHRGMVWTDGQPGETGFCTLMPPNSPSCSPNGSSDAWCVGTASSNHTGGVNAGYIDGSVHFISETIDTNGSPDVAQGPNLQGKSPCGVWGALGSIAGGETTVSVP
jgi:prepilin-type processing-associated H-X9-DG protein